MILDTIFKILLIIWIILASVLIVVGAYRAVVWVFKKLKEYCKTWEEWVYSFLLIDVILMMLVGFLIMLFN